MFFIYILYSDLADKYYVGYTSDPDRRLKDHNEQEYFDTYTSKHRPWKLKAVFSCGENEGEAIKIERFIKRQHSKSLILKLIDDSFVPVGKLAQLVRVPQLRD